MQFPSAILFDIGDTLLDEQWFDLEAGIGAVTRPGADVATLAAAFRSDLADHHERNSELLLAQWLMRRIPVLSSSTVVEVEDRIWGAIVSLTPRVGVATMLRRLHTDGVPVAAVSNAAFSSRVLGAELARHGLGTFLRFVLTSADLGSRKPAALLFETAVQRLGVAPSETWFVGDTLNEDIDGALRAGLQPVWITHGLETTALPFDVPVVHSWPEFLTLYGTVTN